MMFWGIFSLTSKDDNGIWILIGVDFFIGIILCLKKLFDPWKRLYIVFDMLFCFKFYENFIIDTKNKRELDKYLRLRDFYKFIESITLLCLISQNFYKTDFNFALYFTFFLLGMFGFASFFIYLAFRYLLA